MAATELNTVGTAGDDAGERALRLEGALDDGYSNQRSLRSRIC
jgi:hypothetical protein